ncbi:o-succinylbenzoate--CoA ligase [candidate division GN15 bacterium]|nr:o-succinylbenzoate--CoA ligase [candidate division GN15 bacterium]
MRLRRLLRWTIGCSRRSPMPDLLCPIIEAARSYCGHTAIVTPERTVSFDSLDRFTSIVAEKFVEAGVSALDRVAILAGPSLTNILAQLACLRIGAVACPISTRWTADMIETALERLQPVLLVTDSADPQSLDRPAITCETITEWLRTIPAPAPIERPPVRSVDQPATVIFTSGSSDEPKAALLTLGNHYFNALGSNRQIFFRPGDRWLLSLPLYHVGGLAIVFRVLVGGGAVVVPPADMELTDAIARYRISHLSLVSTQFRRLLGSDADLKYLASQLKAVLLGGSAIPASLIRHALDYGLPVHKTYGMTEMASQVATTAPHDLPGRIDTSGRVLDYREVEISDTREILVRGETRFAGYIERDRLERPFDDEDWFATGDTGRLDSNGYLTVFGRTDNMFISGGENIQPEQVEAALGKLDDVLEVLVVPVAEPEYGHRPVAFVRLSPGVMLDERAVRLKLQPMLPRFAIPDRILVWPKSAEGTSLKPSRADFTRLAERIVRESGGLKFAED